MTPSRRQQIAKIDATRRSQRSPNERRIVFIHSIGAAVAARAVRCLDRKRRQKPFPSFFCSLSFSTSLDIYKQQNNTAHSKGLKQTHKRTDRGEK